MQSLGYFNCLYHKPVSEAPSQQWGLKGSNSCEFYMRYWDLHSSQRHDLFMPRVRATMAHTRSFASIGLSLWNHLPPPFRSFILSVPLSSSLHLLKSLPFSWTWNALKALLIWLTVRSTIWISMYNTIYNTIWTPDREVRAFTYNRL